MTSRPTDRDKRFLENAEDAIEYLELARKAMRLAADSSNWDANFAGVIGKIEVAVKSKQQNIDRQIESERKRAERKAELDANT